MLLVVGLINLNKCIHLLKILFFFSQSVIYPVNWKAKTAYILNPVLHELLHERDFKKGFLCFYYLKLFK